MNDKELFKLIKSCLKTKSKIDIKSNTRNVEEWDSLGHLSVLTALDDLTDGKASSLSDLSDATSVAQIINILESEEII